MRWFGHKMVLFIFPVLLGCVVIWPPQAEAHKGHAGSVTQFLDTKEVLRALLPGGAKLVKRKERLSMTSAKSVEGELGIDLDSNIHTYYRANDRSSGEVMGGAIIMKYAYRHGDVVLAVGIDSQNKLTGVAIQGISEKYIPDFEAAFGTGILQGYEGKSVQDLAEMAKAEAKNKPAAFLFSKLAETTAMIAAFLRSADSL